jgi:hypothetical protein
VTAQPTQTRLLADHGALYVRFDCQDSEPWGTLRERDDPLYEEEVVEVFLAPGADDPKAYFEFEVSPHGVLFDARIENPHGARAGIRIGTEWSCEKILWDAAIVPGGWWAALAPPWRSIVEGADPPPVWRGNFYRIDRPTGAAAEYSAWSPTLAEPPDFHRPHRFGWLEL